MTSDPSSSALDALIENILQTRFEQIDGASVENARDRIMDVLGCAVGGADAPGNKRLVELIKEMGGKPEATILIHGGKVPAHNAAMVNAVMARSNDYEPVDVAAGQSLLPAHISGTTVMTALTLGELKGIDGKELITSVLVGDDTAARVLAAAPFRGWDGTGTINALGATAIAGRLLGLDHLQLRDAFGIVLNQLAGSFASTAEKTTAFKLQQGLSARNGIFSAQLAAAGWTGPSDALLGESGYFQLYTQAKPDLEALTKDLGRHYHTEVTFKPFPCCRITHPAVSCALSLVRKHDLKSADIRQVHIYSSRQAVQSMCGVPFSTGRFAHAEAMYSLRYTVAAALVHRDVGLRDFSLESVVDPEINSLAARTELRELPGADFLCAKVELITRGGVQFSEYTDSPKGHPIRNPMSKEELIDKFRSNVAFSGTVSTRNGERLLQMIRELENLGEVSEVIRELGG